MMHPVLFIHSAAKGVLMVNGVFCGPLEEGQSFPAGKNAEVYIQLFPFGQTAPLTAALKLSGGGISWLHPQENAFALLWPDGVIQLELKAAGEDVKQEGQTADGLLLRYLTMRFLGDPQAERLLMRPQDAPDLSGYEAAVPLRFGPLRADPRCDERAGLMRRLAPNVAAVDAALARCVPAGAGIRRIERVEIIKTGG